MDPPARQDLRGNIEEQEAEIGGLNTIDPMKIIPNWRDHYPKMGLDGQYVGDKHMLCSDLPPRSYLRAGSTFRLLGKSKLSEIQPLPLSDPFDNVTVTVLASDSNLRSLLCGMHNNEQCQYPALVTIDTELTCKGNECSLDAVNVVQVEENVHYEYVRPPCVSYAFFRLGKSVYYRRDALSSFCVDRYAAIAAGPCCSATDSDQVDHDTCEYTGERLTFVEAKNRCVSKGQQLCNSASILSTSSSCGSCCNYDGLFWLAGSNCQTFVVIAEDGRVAIEREGEERTNYHTLTFFRVHWLGTFPLAKSTNIDDKCGNFCEIVGDFCRCRHSPRDGVVFDSRPDSRSDVLTMLHVGGIPPTLMDYGFTEVYEYSDGNVTAHFVDDSSTFNQQVIFEVRDEFGRNLYLKNTAPAVKMMNIDNVESEMYMFRNPPTFYTPEPDVR